jgi:hypothetical protein
MPDSRDDLPSRFDPLGLIRVLNEHGVDYVVIGGYAAGVQGALWATVDLDLVYATDRTNYDRLAAALRALDAQPIGLPPGVVVALDARALRAGDLWTLATRLGQLDLMREPAPGLNYARLREQARTIRGRETYNVASINDLITMKRHAGRPKDVGQVQLLELAADETQRRQK